MENYKEKIIITNNESDFISNSESDFSATYLILCKNESEEDKKILNTPVFGLTLDKWVAMACETKPVILNINGDENILSLAKPYVNNSEYIVILYANTPLITKTHLNDMISFVARRRFNVCKLKKGYILRSDFAIDAENIYSNFAYDLITNDFFEVNSMYDFETVRDNLEKRIINHHLSRGVIFENPKTVSVDASVKIGSGSIVSSSAILAKNTTIGSNVQIGANAIILNSKIENDAKIGAGAVIENSIVKSGCEVLSASNLYHSVIGENVLVGFNSKVIDSAVESDSKIGNFVVVDSASIGKDAVVEKFSNIAGVGVTVVVDDGTIIPAFSKIVKNED